MNLKPRLTCQLLSGCCTPYCQLQGPLDTANPGHRNVLRHRSAFGIQVKRTPLTSFDRCASAPLHLIFLTRKAVGFLRNIFCCRWELSSRVKLNSMTSCDSMLIKHACRSGSSGSCSSCWIQLISCLDFLESGS